MNKDTKEEGLPEFIEKLFSDGIIKTVFSNECPSKEIKTIPNYAYDKLMQTKEGRNSLLRYVSSYDVIVLDYIDGKCINFRLNKDLRLELL